MKINQGFGLSAMPEKLHMLLHFRAVVLSLVRVKISKVNWNCDCVKL